MFEMNVPLLRLGSLLYVGAYGFIDLKRRHACLIINMS